MSKIEEYREQKKITGQVIRMLRHASGLKEDGTNDTNIDKGGIDFYGDRVWDQDIQIYFHASYGYYGSSSGYSACFPEMKPYILMAINRYKDDIVNLAMQLAKEDEQKALVDCKEEAESILAEISDIDKTE